MSLTWAVAFAKAAEVGRGLGQGGVVGIGGRCRPWPARLPKTTFQAAVGMPAGCSGACCEAQSMVWPAAIWLDLHRDLVAVDRVVRQEREGELAALAGPQDARRPAGGHGQDLGGAAR